jgi:capsular polysaccharide biosynthesis protein
MAKVPIKIRLLFWLRRRLSPRLYVMLRNAYRLPVDFILECLRKLVPARFAWGPPRGFFLEHELLGKKQLHGRIVLAGQPAPVLAPDSLRKVCGLGQDGWQPWPVFWTHHPQARLIGSTLVLLDSQKRLSYEGAFSPCATSDPAYRNIFLPRATVLPGNWTSVLGQWVDGYYHWFLDVLPRLSLLPELPEDIRVMVPAGLNSYRRDTLKWLGLENRVRPTAEKHLLVENYYFCSPTAMTGCYNPHAVQFLRRAFLSRADLAYDPPRRFYLRRVGQVRPILNEDEIVDFFRKKGWAIVDTEQLPLAQQIQLFARAEMICAPHGAGLTNLLWCQPGCRVLELCASTFLNGCFEGLAECLRLDHHYLVYAADWSYQARVDLKALERALEF